jgi:two-component system cell cycle sensor histidine kinase/response regulator CckA
VAGRRLAESDTPATSPIASAATFRRAGPALRSVVVSGLAVSAAGAARAAIDPLVGSADPALTIFIFLVAVGIAAILEGVAGGITALAAGGFAAWFLFLQGQFPSAGFDPIALVGLALYVQTGVGIVFLAAAQRTAHLRVNAAAIQSAAQAEQLRREVAARRRAEEAHRRTEERYRTPADQVKDYALFMLDRHGQTASWNEGVERVLGYTKAEFVRAPVAMLYPEEDQAAGLPQQELAEAVAHGDVTTERWLVRKGGKRFWASESTSRIYGREGQVLGFAKRLRDLSGLREVQDELRRNQEALQLAHEAAQLATWDHDLLTGEMRWDARAKALFGFTPDTTITDALWANAVYPADLASCREVWSRALRERKPFSVEFRVVWPDGTLHWITAVGQATFDAATGTAVRLTGVMLDGTERREAEERLQEVLRLEAIGRLAGGIAHDLNNMLVAILGFSDLLSRSLEPRDPRLRDVEQITEAAGRSAKLTRQLLAFARRELIQPQHLELNAIVARAEGMLRSVLGENIEFLLERSPDAGVIYADPSQVEQIVMNLVLNARDAMPQGGRLTLETASLALGGSTAFPAVAGSAEAGERYVMLAVRDTGHGMDALTLQRMWEPFFTTKPAGKGTGLGLAAVYGAVKQSGGFVWAESQPSRGTTVSVYWPQVLHGPEQLLAPSTVRYREGGTETLLIVEDEALVRALTVRTLEELGYRCLEAPSAGVALRLIDEGVRPDLVITDVVLPEISGAEFGERLAHLRPELPVMYTSGFSDEDVIRRGLLRSGRPFLQKPFTPSDLARKVREVLLNATGSTSHTHAG